MGKKVTSSEKRDHWLDYAEDKYSKKLIADVKAVLSVLFLYIPIPIFWALFDQQVSATQRCMSRGSAYRSRLFVQL